MQEPFPIDDEVLLRYTGQTQVRSIEGAKVLLDEAIERPNEIKRQRSRLLLQAPSRFLRWLSTYVSTGDVRIDSLIAGIAIGFLISLPIVKLLGPGLGSSFLILICSIGTGFGLCWWTLRDRPHEDEGNRKAVRRRDWGDLFEERRRLREELGQSAEEIERARTLLVGMRDAVAHRGSPRKKAEPVKPIPLASAPLPPAANDMAAFLEGAFKQAGYPYVERIANVEQGVHLIVGDARLRIAVQARPDDIVSNDAVQQVVAGALYHRCDRSAVVTKGTFTPAAKELAATAKCRLIDGSVLADLVSGQIRL